MSQASEGYKIYEEAKFYSSIINNLEFKKKEVSSTAASFIGKFLNFWQNNFYSVMNNNENQLEKLVVSSLHVLKNKNEQLFAVLLNNIIGNNLLVFQLIIKLFYYYL